MAHFKKLSVEEVESQLNENQRVIVTVTKDDGSTEDVAFRYPRYKDQALCATAMKTLDHVTAQVQLLRMTCLTHDAKELEVLFEQISGMALILKVSQEFDAIVSRGVEVKKA